MKLRLVTALALSGALLLSVSGAQAATPTMDGKKVKALTKVVNAGLAENDADTLTDVDVKIQCPAAKCAKLAFVYKPAKGVKGGLMFTATWTNALSDFDLYAVELDKRGSATAVGSCGSFARATEKVYVGPSLLRSGRTYAIVIYFARSVNDTVTGKVEINVPDSTPKTVPAVIDSKQKTNCSL